MPKVKRQIITIDEEDCDGCGNCVPACVEGALQIVNGKARLVKESYCDGLGACLGDCPHGALRVMTLEVEAYDEPAVLVYLQQAAPEMVERHVTHLAEHGIASSQQTAAQPGPAAIPLCPSVQDFGEPSRAVQGWDEGWTTGGEPTQGRVKSELRQWPVQLHLLPVRAPFFQGAILTLIADCVPFADPNMHAEFVRGSAIAVGCPKLDDAQAYVGKVTEILQNNDIRGLKVAYMEVPCCRGLVFVAQQALKVSGKEIPFDIAMVPISE